MILKSSQFAASLAIASGLALLFPSVSQAQIRVTGGQLSGNAAFFVPGQNITSGQPTPVDTSLFDLTVQQLRIESENGTTTTSIFVPTGATFDDGGNRSVDPGDTGIIEGLLSGVALTQTGNLLPFSQRETVLSFQVDAFNPALNFNGTLLSPSVLGSAPLIFLPGLTNATVQGNQFIATGGELQVGDLDSSLTDGLINLPSTLTFADSGSGGNPPPAFSLLQRVNFNFRGANLAAGSYQFDSTGDGIRFVGEANQQFEINGQSESGQGPNFTVRGAGGVVDATLTGAVAFVNEGQPLDRFEIRGTGEISGVLESFGAYGTNGIAFASDGSTGEIRYSFQQGNARAEGQASDISFVAYPGLGDISDIDTDLDDGYDFDDSFDIDDDFDFDDDFGDDDFDDDDDDDDGRRIITRSICNVCQITINTSTPVRVGPFVTVVNPGRTIQVTGGTTSQTVNNYSIAVNLLDFRRYTSSTTVSTNLVALASFDVTSFTRELILLSDASTITFGTTSEQQQYEIVYREYGSNRYYVIVPRNRIELGEDDLGLDDDFEIDDDDFEIGDDDLEIDDDLEVDDDDFEVDDDTSIVAAYRLVGPSSRIFPSLVGLRQLSPDAVIELDTGDDDGLGDDIDEGTDLDLDGMDDDIDGELDDDMSFDTDIDTDEDDLGDDLGDDMELNLDGVDDGSGDDDLDDDMSLNVEGDSDQAGSGTDIELDDNTVVEVEGTLGTPED